jgi:virginiamycin B lyase
MKYERHTPARESQQTCATHTPAQRAGKSRSTAIGERRRSRRPTVEGLESRSLPTSLSLFSLPTGTRPFDLVNGPDGNLWFVDLGKSIDSFNPTTQSTTATTLPGGGGMLRGIAVGPDGNIWFTDSGANAVGTINLTTHAMNEFPVPTANAGVDAMTAGPDGNLWFVEWFAGKLGSINPATHAMTEYPLPTNADLFSGPFESDLTVGSDGNLWFTSPASNAISTFNLTTHDLTQFPIPTPYADPEGITTGPDGNLWFTDGPGAIGTINPTTHVIATYVLQTMSSGMPVLPEGITAGPDGNIWFANLGGNSVGMIDPTTHAITEFPVPNDVPNGCCGPSPFAIVAGPNDTIWYTLPGSAEIGMISLSPADSGSAGSPDGTEPASPPAADTPPAPELPFDFTIGFNGGSAPTAGKPEATIALALGNTPTTGGNALSVAGPKGLTAFSGLTVRRFDHGAAYRILAGKGAVATRAPALRTHARPGLLATEKVLTAGKGKDRHVVGVRIVLAKRVDSAIAGGMTDRTADIPAVERSTSLGIEVSYQTPAGAVGLVLHGKARIEPTGQIIVIVKTLGG